MATLTHSAEDLYGTINKFDNTYECNTVLFKVNSEKDPDSEIIKVIKEYSKTDTSIIEDTKIDILGLLSQATVLCSGVNKGYLVDTYDTTDICVMLFSRSLPDYDLRNPKVIDNLCGFMFLDTKRTKSGLWNMGTLQKMLANRTYTGIHNVHVKKLDRTFSFKVPKIITVSQFNRVQKLLQRNQKMKDNNKKHDSLLGDFLVCECGTTISSEVKTKNRKDGSVIKTRKYYCMNKNYEWRDGIDRGCNNKKSLDMDRTDEVIVERVKQVALDSNTLKEETKKSVLESRNETRRNIDTERERLEEKCQRIQSTIDNLENQIVDMEMEKTLGKKDESK